MEEKLNHTQQQVAETEAEAALKKIITSNPILCKELIAELRASRKATEELTAKTWELITKINEVIIVPKF